mmetsp:Transcript_32043/g.96434  ORF Transcript_32043/g.96434 Transcript_32043/m.96434 type:complete len:1595 (+) Transcript_32043:1276-6060(+)
MDRDEAKGADVENAAEAQASAAADGFPDIVARAVADGRVAEPKRQTIHARGFDRHDVGRAADDGSTLPRAHHRLDLLFGHVVRQTFWHFELAIGHWLIARLRAEYTQRQSHAAAVEPSDADLANELLHEELHEELPAQDAPAAASAPADDRADEGKGEAWHGVPWASWQLQIWEHFGEVHFVDIAADMHWDTLTIAEALRCFYPSEFPHKVLEPILAVAAARLRWGHVSKAIVTENDVVRALEAIAKLLEIEALKDDPQCAAAACSVSALLKDAHALTANGTAAAERKAAVDWVPVVVPGLKLTEEDVSAQLFFETWMEWEQHFQRETGFPLRFEGTSALVDGGSESWWSDVVHKEEVHMEAICEGRRWYFYNQRMQRAEDVLGAAYRAMEALQNAVRAMCKSKHFAQWCPPSANGSLANAEDGAKSAESADSVSVDWTPRYPYVLSNDDAVVREAAVSREDLPFVGREQNVATVTTFLQDHGGCVVIHGRAGVGKDALVMAVRHRLSIKGMTGSLNATTDAALRSALIETFIRQRPTTVTRFIHSESDALGEIMTFLAETPEWTIFVQNASLESELVGQLINMSDSTRRVVITTRDKKPRKREEKERLERVGHWEELSVLSPKQCVEVLVRLLRDALPPNSDPERRHDSEAQLEQRCNSEKKFCYLPPHHGESKREEAARHLKIESGLRMHTEFSSQEMLNFIATSLRNLPRSVILFGLLIRDEAPQSVQRRGNVDVPNAISHFNKRAGLAEIDAIGRNAFQDTLHVAFAQTILRLETQLDSLPVHEVDKQGALALLAALAVLHCVDTPISLLKGYDTTKLASCVSIYDGIEVEDAESALAIFGDDEALMRARALCLYCGFITPARSGSDIVGVMPLRMQLYLRRKFVAKSALGRIVMFAVRIILVSRFDAMRGMSPDALRRLQPLTPSVHTWCECVLGHGDSKPEDLATDGPLQPAEADATLLARYGMWQLGLKNAVVASTVFRQVLASRRRLVLPDHPALASSASHLAVAYAALGRLGDSLKLHQEALAFRRRVLEPGHDEITTSVLDVAATYTRLGKPEEAQRVYESALQSDKEQLPPDHAVVELWRQRLDPSFELDGEVCAQCLKTGKKGSMGHCSGCRKVRYCSTSCQKHHWKRGGHKQECKLLQESGRAKKAEQKRAPRPPSPSLSASLQPTGPTCASCSKERDAKNMKRCRRCMAVYYCSEECQRQHWKVGGHKDECKPRSESVKPGGARPASDLPELKHPCPVCLDNEDDAGEAGMCYACGALFCGQCNTTEKLGNLPCPKCRHPLPRMSNEGIVKLLWDLIKKRRTGRHVAAAMHLLGSFYAAGKGVDKDLARAVTFYQHAVDRKGVGSMEALISLAVCYERGEGIDEDAIYAAHLYRKAAMTGHRKAQYNLANCYMVGKGVGQDRAKAACWLRLSAEQGYANAQLALGSCYDRGDGVDLDPRRALKLFEQAAVQGVAAAQNSAANAYLNGMGSEQDTVTAVKYFQMAADQGHSGAQFQLAILYLKGRDRILPDHDKAIPLLRACAEQQHAGGLFTLGTCYGTGRGVKRDLDEAERYFRLAAAEGHTQALQYMVLVNHANSPDK